MQSLWKKSTIVLLPRVRHRGGTLHCHNERWCVQNAAGVEKRGSRVSEWCESGTDSGRSTRRSWHSRPLIAFSSPSHRSLACRNSILRLVPCRSVMAVPIPSNLRNKLLLYYDVLRVRDPLLLVQRLAGGKLQGSHGATRRLPLWLCGRRGGIQ